MKERAAVDAEDYDLAKKLKLQREALMKPPPPPPPPGSFNLFGKTVTPKATELTDEEKRVKRVRCSGTPWAFSPPCALAPSPLPSPSIGQSSGRHPHSYSSF
eukprot:SAG22_NODE_749_length_7484_cov_3.144347_5_plen_102_part_00